MVEDDQMTMGPVHSFSFRIFGRYATQRLGANPRLQITLLRAHIPLRPDVYIATGYMVLLASLVLAVVPTLAAVGLWLGGVILLPLPLVVVGIVTPFALALAVYSTWMVLPAIRAGTRARRIDARLPYALNYMATMAAAGATPEKIFRQLGVNALYGEVREEAAWIRRDVEVLGHDIITALNAASGRSPSLRFQDVLQGAVTVLIGGGDLRTYFMAKSEQFLVEARQQQTRFLDTLGVVAEAYVTVVVAAPLFLIVMLSVLVTFGSTAESVLSLGYILVVLLIPLAQVGFIMSVGQMAPEE